jgi:hypothetical protein
MTAGEPAGTELPHPPAASLPSDPNLLTAAARRGTGSRFVGALGVKRARLVC